jgi:hypothetical protein
MVLSLLLKKRSLKSFTQLPSNEKIGKEKFFLLPTLPFKRYQETLLILTKKILSLRSADNVYAFVAEVNGVPSDAEGLLFLEKIPPQCDWEPAIALWKVVLPLITNGGTYYFNALLPINHRKINVLSTRTYDSYIVYDFVDRARRSKISSHRY